MEASTAACVVAGALLCGAAGLLVPRVVALLPAPERPPADAGEPGSRAEPDDDAPPAETYAEVAARPGLAWKAAVASAVAGGAVAARLDWSWSLLHLLPLVPVLVGLSVVDWRTQLLPKRVVWPAVAGTAVLLLVEWLARGAGDAPTDDLVRAAVGSAVAFATFYALWFVHPRGLGFGDVRLAALLGLALGMVGWGELLVGLYAGFLLGGLGGGLLALLRVVRRRSYPFGPFLAAGALAGVLVGAPVLDRLVVG